MSSRKPPSNSGNWDDFDIPTWDDAAGNPPTRDYPSSSQSRRPAAGRTEYPDPLYDDYDTGAPPSRRSSRPPAASQQPPRLSNRVPTRSTRPSPPDPYRDPYIEIEETYIEERYYAPAQGGMPPQRRPSASSQYDLYADPALDPGWDQGIVYEDERAPGRRSRQRSRSARPSVSVARPAISDTAITGILAAAAVSLLLMIIAVWYGMGDVADVIPWHMNASGDVDRWVSSSTLWRLPFGSFMALVIGVILGAFLWKRDRFAARFIITSMCVVQVLAWVAVIDQIW